MHGNLRTLPLLTGWPVSVKGIGRIMRYWSKRMYQYLVRVSWVTIAVIAFAIVWHYGADIKAVADYLM